jgi:nitrogenase molybdenum-iron protein alpha/beta subunit
MTSQLSVYLPPFAADYAGVCSALSGYDCLIVIDDARCCSRGYLTVDEPRPNRSTFSSQLRGVEAVLGDADRLVGQTIQAINELEPRFAAVVSTPVTALIGRDMEDVAAQVEERAGVPVLGFATTGFRPYTVGASNAYVQLLERFGALASPGLGAIPLDGYLTAPECYEWTLCSASGLAAARTLPHYRTLPEQSGWDVTSETLIVGDQIIANAIRATSQATVGSFFGLDPQFAREGDIALTCEAHLAGLLASGRFRRLIADPLVCRLPQARELSCDHLPHPAVSGHLFTPITLKTV